MMAFTARIDEHFNIDIECLKCHEHWPLDEHRLHESNHRRRFLIFELRCIHG